MKELKKKPFLTTREILRVIWKPMLLVVAVCVASGYAIIKMEPNSPDPKNWEGTAVQELILENQHLDELLDESERTIAELRRELESCQTNEKPSAPHYRWDPTSLDHGTASLLYHTAPGLAPSPASAGNECYRACMSGRCPETCFPTPASAGNPRKDISAGGIWIK